MGASSYGETIKLDENNFKKGDRITARCTGLSSKISYTLGMYNRNGGKLTGKVRRIKGSTSKTSYFNAPAIGKYKLKLKSGGSNKAKRAFKVTSDGGTNPDPDPDPDPDPPNGSGNFTASSGTTDLNYADTTAFVNAYKGLGYSFKGYTKKVKRSQLQSFLKASNNMHFHSGHGNEGSINCTDGDLNVGSINVNVQYCIFATCLTLKDNGWYNVFGSNAKMVMGFTEVTTDGSCLSMAKSFPAKLKSGNSYLKAWYLTNSVIKQHQDRWATYVKEGSKIVFYSAKGKHPYIAYSGRTKTLSENVKTYKMALYGWKNTYFGRGTSTAILSKSKKKLKFKRFPKSTMSTGGSVAISEAYDSLGNNLPDNADVDEIIPIERCVSANVCSVVAYNIYFVQKYNGFPIRSNSTTDYISILVGENGVASTDISWSKVTSLDTMYSVLIPLSVSEALKTAANGISNITKKVVIIVDFERVYGAPTNKYGDTLITPAYEFIGSKGERFVVDAYTGMLID